MKSWAIGATALLNRPYPNEVPATLIIAHGCEPGLMTIRIELEGEVAMKLTLNPGELLRAIADVLIEAGQ